jgi:predicted DNA-binding transcriptional regulator YafY
VQNTRFQRVFRLLSYLQSGPRFNAEQLAHQFRVSRRTIFRDIMFLREMGVPVIFDEGHSAYRLSPHFQIARTLSVSDEELTMLFLAAHLSLAQAVPELGAVVREAMAKLMCNVPEETRTEIASLLNTCIPEFETPAPDWRALMAILRAIRAKRQIRIHVAADPPARSLETKVAPYRVVATPRTWLLVGRSSFHRRVRTFDVSDVQRVEITEDTYSVPHRFRHRAFSPSRESPSKVSDARSF